RGRNFFGGLFSRSFFRGSFLSRSFFRRSFLTRRFLRRSFLSRFLGRSLLCSLPGWRLRHSRWRVSLLLNYRRKRRSCFFAYHDAPLFFFVIFEIIVVGGEGNRNLFFFPVVEPIFHFLRKSFGFRFKVAVAAHVISAIILP